MHPAPPVSNGGSPQDSAWDTRPLQSQAKPSSTAELKPPGPGPGHTMGPWAPGHPAFHLVAGPASLPQTSPSSMTAYGSLRIGF
jgi:hypothetical protein